jgi:hypothetical protein
MVDMDTDDPATTTRRTFLTATAAAAATPLLIEATPAAGATPPADGPGQPIQSQPPDRELRALLREIDRDRIETTVRRLVAFGTRHTLSNQDDPVRGIGAARDWIRDQFESSAAASDGRMTVQLQSFVQPAGPRIPSPTTITNVFATLRGTPHPTGCTWCRPTTTRA